VHKVSWSPEATTKLQTLEGLHEASSMLRPRNNRRHGTKFVAMNLCTPVLHAFSLYIVDTADWWLHENTAEIGLYICCIFGNKVIRSTNSCVWQSFLPECRKHTSYWRQQPISDWTTKKSGLDPPHKQETVSILKRAIADLGATEPPTQPMPTARSLGVNRSKPEANHSPAPSSEVKNAWSYTSIPHLSSRRDA
jgi:hypothetical protein